MASIALRSNGKWRARYRDDSGKEHARHFDRKRDAQRWLDEVTTSKLTGKYVDPNAGKVKFQAYASDWFESTYRRESTSDLYERYLDRHINPALGNTPLAKITPRHVQKLVLGLTSGVDDRDPLSPSTVTTIYKVTASIFRAAVRDKMISESPCVDISLPEVTKTRIRPVTKTQVDAIYAGLPEALRAIVILAAGTGLRQGELLGLTRDRLGLEGDSPQVEVDRQMLTPKKGKPHHAPLKTSSSYRTIPLPRSVVRELGAHLERVDVAPDGLVFERAKNEPWSRSRFSEVWRPVARAAGLTRATGTGIHALRHYYASLLIRHGESVKTVQARLGHKSAAETLDTYSHLWPDSDDRTRMAIDSVFDA